MLSIALPLVMAASMAVMPASGAVIDETDFMSAAKPSNNLDSMISGKSAQSDYVITGVEFEGSTAKVSYTAKESCTIEVALYDENTGEMIASGNARAEASKEETALAVEINRISMPESFIVKAFILDNDNAPLTDCFTIKLNSEQEPDIPDDKTFNAHTKDTTPIKKSGNCGEKGKNVKYELHENGTLYIYGEGMIKAYKWNESPFFNNMTITNVIIEYGVTNIGQDLFYKCESIKSIEIPNSVESIDRSAIYGCSSLTRIKIPGSVTSIGSDAFRSCSILTIIEMPSSVKSIGASAFCYCESLVAVYYTGTESERLSVSVGIYNTEYSNATFFYNSKMPEPSGTSLPNTSGTVVTTAASTKSEVKIYSDLIPNARYIFMLVRDENAADLLSHKNLVYIDQFNADKNGALTAEYPKTYGSDYTMLIFGGKTTVTNDEEPTTPDEPVSGHTPGDINGDGKVNMKDLTRLHQHINGWDVTVNEAALDINGDGRVNMKDLTRLHQYINGWDVNIS